VSKKDHKARRLLTAVTAVALGVAWHSCAGSESHSGVGDPASARDAVDLRDTQDTRVPQDYVPVPESMYPHPEWKCALDPEATSMTCPISCDTGRDCPPGWSCLGFCEGNCVRDIVAAPPCESTSCDEFVSCDGPAIGGAVDLSPIEAWVVCEPRLDAENPLPHCHEAAMAIPGKVGDLRVIGDKDTFTAFMNAIEPCTHSETCFKWPWHGPGTPDTIPFDTKLVVLTMTGGRDWGNSPDDYVYVDSAYDFPGSGTAVVVAKRHYGPLYPCAIATGPDIRMYLVDRPAPQSSLTGCRVTP